MNVKKAFTLIELLVVIAIIGILSSIILSALNTARSKASDAAVKSNLATLRTQSIIYYDSTGSNSYSPAAGSATGVISSGTAATCSLANTFMSDSKINNILFGVDKASGGDGSFAAGSKVRCQITAGPPGALNTSIVNPGTPATEWTVWAPTVLNSGWCIDWSGKSEASIQPAAQLVTGTLGCP
jgi:prepilin-type N-terminal cleavage/methylation domain-containing protein